MNFIFGYGSLICSDSRSRTGVSGPAFPIEVEGIARRWSLHSPDWPATAVSAHLSQESSCNGVFFEVDNINLERFDAREAGYDRIEIPWQKVTNLTEDPLPETGVLWAYVGKSTGQPTLNRPIMQSYLDVILNGCLDISDDFASRFAVLTEQWQHLVDDRHAPQYLRPLRSNHRTSDIDRVLERHLPELITQRRVFDSVGR